jgi:AcrR family transcriptional regulator
MKAAEDTSSLLIESGIALFGARGYDGVTTRELAQGARTNISSIKYHFGGKDGLYRAVLEQIIHEITDLIGPLLLTLRNGVAEANGDREVLTRLALGDPRTQKRVPPIVREVIQPSRHFTVIYNGFFRVLYDVLGELIAAAHGQAAVDEQLQIRTHIVMNVVWGFIFTEFILWRQMGWNGYNRTRIETIVPVLADAFVLSIGLAKKPAGGVQRQIAERG